MTLPGELQYAYTAAVSLKSDVAQVSEYNSFIANETEALLYNSAATSAKVTLTAIDYNGKVVASHDVTLIANETARVVFDDLPKDSYGTIVLNSDVAGVFMQNLTRRGSDYVLTYSGQ